MTTSALVADLLAFLGASPTPYHAVRSVEDRLRAANFSPLVERDAWSLAPSKNYFITIGESAIVAFCTPEKFDNAQFHIVGAHTDSPNLRLKPKPEYTKEGYAQLGVEVYGGALLNSWLDRDLSLAGRVLVRGANGSTESRLVKFDRIMARVPQLAIHLDRDVNEKGVVLNKQEHLAPVFGLSSRESPAPEITALCASEIGVDASAIVSTDLMLYDVTAPAIGGSRGEFIFSARLDNLAMCHAAMSALIASASASRESTVPVIALFDHEEVGSESSTGAHSSFLPRILERIARTRSLGKDTAHEDYARALARSSCISADMAHAIHPNYAERHEARHRPTLNGGPVLKVNSQQRYATSAHTAAMFKDLCAEANVPMQHFVTRTDLPCGSTIGPITSTLLGIPTVDVGNPMLSMHSIREMCGVEDPERMTRVMELYFRR
jgi:aspartyl aminopeptidase